MTRYWRQAVAALTLTVLTMPAFADDVDELRKLRDSTISLVNALVDQGVLTRAKADEIIAQATQAGAKPAPGTAPGSAPGSRTPSAPATAAAPPTAAPGSAAAATPAVAPGTVRVPYVPDTVKDEIRDEVKQDVLAQAKQERWGQPGAFPDWLQHFNFYGDIRLRFEADRFPTDNTANASVPILNEYGVNIANSTDPDNRTRVRARFGFDATVGDTVTVGMRFATGGVGSGSNPGSENQTLGNYETRSTVGFDRAYLAYRPLSWLLAEGGRIGNPFFKPTTLIWADDVSLEGFAVHLDPQFGPRWTWVTTAGLFPILQNDPTSTSDSPSKWLYAYQSGFDLRFGETSNWWLTAALYDYRHIEGIPNPPTYPGETPITEYSATAAPFRQTGNTVFDINGLTDIQTPGSTPLYGLASKFHELNLSTLVDYGFIGRTHLMLGADWVRNLGFDANEIYERTGFHVGKETTGWQTKLTVGYPDFSRKYNWQAWLGYRYAERDSTVDAFTDQDFHLGGTDAKGYFLGGSFAFEKNTYVTLRWFSAKQIDGVELAGAVVAGGLPLAIDVLQIDLSGKF